MNRKLNIRYTFTLMSYYGLIASTYSFASVYLLDIGYDNSTIGTVLAITGILTIVFQALIANYLDQHPEIRIQNAVTLQIFLVIVASILLLFVPKNIAILLLVVVVFSFSKITESFINSMAFIFEPFDIRINYGFSRGMGSLSFALTTIAVGYGIDLFGPPVIPVFYVLFSTSLFLATRSFSHPREIIEAVHVQTAPINSSNATFIDFIKQYKSLTLFMIGVLFVFFMHTIINNFLIQIIVPIGGDSVSMGTAIFIGAVVGIPTMIFYEPIERYFKIHTVLNLTAFFFLLKHLVTYFATNMAMFYFAQILQIGAFSLIIPAGVSYVGTIVSKKHLLKGQAFFTSSMALSSIAGNFFGGLLLDYVGVSRTLFIGVILTFIGSLIIWLSTKLVDR